MSTLPELKSAFYDSQRQASNLFEAIYGELQKDKQTLAQMEEKKPKEESKPKKA